MSSAHPRHNRNTLRTRPTLLLADLGLLAWVAGWIYVAVRVGLDVRSLGPLPRTLHSAGVAIATTGHAVSDLGHIPFIGHSLHNLGHRVLAAGKNTEATAHTSRKSIRQLSVLLPIVIAIVPIVPVLLVYVPLRVQRWREARTVLTVMRQGDELGARRFLAHRAVSTLSFHRLESVTDDPWAALQQGDYEELADAELRRLGIIVRTDHGAS